MRKATLGILFGIAFASSVVCYHVVETWDSRFGGGFYATSPNKLHKMAVNGNAETVEILVTSDTARDLCFEYLHNADAFFFREKPNSVIWSADSGVALAQYTDILNGRQYNMRFTYNRDGSWSLQGSPVIAPLGSSPTAE